MLLALLDHPFRIYYMFKSHNFNYYCGSRLTFKGLLQAYFLIKRQQR